MTVETTTATTISLSWTSAGSVVDSYEVMWERDTSGECPDEDEGSTTITGNFTNYTITELEEHSSYTISVKASNVLGIAVSNSVYGVTGEASELALHSTKTFPPLHKTHGLSNLIALAFRM